MNFNFIEYILLLILVTLQVELLDMVILINIHKIINK